jgi:hypothetical protein
MPTGPGKYDDVCTAVRAQTQAKGVIVVIFDGNKGGGFSMQADLETTMKLPELLRILANKIEHDLTSC